MDVIDVLVMIVLGFAFVAIWIFSGAAALGYSAEKLQIGYWKNSTLRVVVGITITIFCILGGLLAMVTVVTIWLTVKLFIIGIEVGEGLAL